MTVHDLYRVTKDITTIHILNNDGEELYKGSFYTLPPIYMTASVFMLEATALNSITIILNTL